METFFYLAYGANTHRDHMRHRCPDAIFIGTAKLIDYMLVFRGVADVVPRNNFVVHCALWKISVRDLVNLDRFENYPTLYKRKFSRILINNRERSALFYYMQGKRKDEHEPPQLYEQVIREGYFQCRLSIRQVDNAILRARVSAHRQQRYAGNWIKQQIKESK
jgi:gamma-glutamylcyclotransferase (GGCT)/AIG2-like uncharacterized protein YtfP